ncbi:flagellar hook-length control protein FliK [Mesobaculum littorinae]|nr:flagellar hook-length control protein FliK [Mesobaculum littorinae]
MDDGATEGGDTPAPAAPQDLGTDAQTPDEATVVGPEPDVIGDEGTGAVEGDEQDTRFVMDGDGPEVGDAAGDTPEDGHAAGRDADHPRLAADAGAPVTSAPASRDGEGAAKDQAPGKKRSGTAPGVGMVPLSLSFGARNAALATSEALGARPEGPTGPASVPPVPKRAASEAGIARDVLAGLPPTDAQKVAGSQAGARVDRTLERVVMAGEGAGPRGPAIPAPSQGDAAENVLAVRGTPEAAARPDMTTRGVDGAIIATTPDRAGQAGTAGETLQSSEQAPTRPADLAVRSGAILEAGQRVSTTDRPEPPAAPSIARANPTGPSAEAASPLLSSERAAGPTQAIAQAETEALPAKARSAPTPDEAIRIVTMAPQGAAATLRGSAVAGTAEPDGQTGAQPQPNDDQVELGGNTATRPVRPEGASGVVEMRQSGATVGAPSPNHPAGIVPASEADSRSDQQVIRSIARNTPSGPDVDARMVIASAGAAPRADAVTDGPGARRATATARARDEGPLRADVDAMVAGRTSGATATAPHDPLGPASTPASALTAFAMPDATAPVIGMTDADALPAMGERAVGASAPEALVQASGGPQAPTPADAARPVQAPTAPPLPQAVSRQILDAAQGMGAGPVEIEVMLEDMGRLRIVMTAAETGLSVDIRADQDASLSLARRHAEALALDLQGNGFADVDISFGRGDDPDARPGADTARDGETQDTPTTPAMRRADTLGSSGLDLRL